MNGRSAVWYGPSVTCAWTCWPAKSTAFDRSPKPRKRSPGFATKPAWIDVAPLVSAVILMTPSASGDTRSAMPSSRVATYALPSRCSSTTLVAAIPPAASVPPGRPASGPTTIRNGSGSTVAVSMPARTVRSIAAADAGTHAQSVTTTHTQSVRRTGRSIPGGGLRSRHGAGNQLPARADDRLDLRHLRAADHAGLIRPVGDVAVLDDHVTDDDVGQVGRGRHRPSPGRVAQDLDARARVTLERRPVPGVPAARREQPGVRAACAAGSDHQAVSALAEQRRRVRRRQDGRRPERQRWRRPPRQAAEVRAGRPAEDRHRRAHPAVELRVERDQREVVAQAVVVGDLERAD